MSVIVVLIGVSLFVALAFLGAFVWSVRQGQYDDTHTPSIRILFEENAYENTTANNDKHANDEA